MRHLNKVIFINSAHIPYAEVKIDGNVHFIGTQGVGKSTVLRAILFFYNADSTKLGIGTGKKPFHEYYFPYDDSYIIYEVKAESYFYCVCAYKANGRVCFKFMNSHFDRNYFIDGAGNAYSEWRDITQLVPKDVHITRRVDKYEEYRDIIFGNNRLLAPELRRYALTESRSYRNIPRTIQNVFLNSKLEAEFIKQTIIMSMNEEETSIDLSKYSRHIDQFQQQYNDISKWKQVDKNNGKNNIRSIADKVIDSWRNGKSLAGVRKELARQLNYSFRMAQERLPIEQARFDEMNLRMKDLNFNLEDLAGKFKIIEDKLKSEITLFRDKIRESDRKLSEYAKKGIDEVLVRVARKEEVSSFIKNLEDKLSILLSRSKDIDSKFEQLIRQENNAFDSIINVKKGARLELLSSINEAISSLEVQYAKIIEEIRGQGETLLEQQREKIAHLNNEINNLKVRKALATREQPYEDDIKAFEDSIAGLREKKKDAKRVLESGNDRINNHRLKWDTELKLLDSGYNSDIKEIKRRQDEAQYRIGQIDEMLLNTKGSFFEWLNGEYPEWKDTIGKVIDEEKVLFNRNLSPRRVSSDNTTLFGVEIDFNEISKNVKSLKDYQDEKSQLDSVLKECMAGYKSLSDELKKSKDKLMHEFNPLIKQIKDEVKIAELALYQSDAKIKEHQVALSDLKKKAEQEKISRIGVIDDEINAMISSRMKLEDDLLTMKSDIQKRIDGRNNEKNAIILDKRTEINKAENALEEEIVSITDAHKQRLDSINNDKLKALGENGVDTEAVVVLNSDIEKEKAELAFIEDNQTLVIEYNKDKRELFDKLPEYKEGLQKNQDILNSEQDNFRINREETLLALRNIKLRAGESEVVINKIRSNINEVNDFILTDIYSHIKDIDGEEKNNLDCISIIYSIHDNSSQFEKNLNLFKELSRKFTGHFTTDNIFGFKVELTSDQDFDSFADNLNDFIEDCRLDVFERETQNRFVNIVQTFAKDMGILLEKEGEIQKVISDINRDFDSKGKFALVIKLIELRRVDSEQQVIKLLKKIQDFCNEHMSELGGMNLFSTDNKDSINKEAMELLSGVVKEINLLKDKRVTLSDSFDLQFRIMENDNDSGFVSKLANVGSDGTDVLVKAMINIMLLNVFKEKASRGSKEFRLHCMMDEIGKLHPNNIKGILDFANARNILLLNSSPTSYRAVDYKYTYLLAKDAKSNTSVKMLISVG